MVDMVTVTIDLEGTADDTSSKIVEISLIGGPGFVDDTQILRRSTNIAVTDSVGQASFEVVSNERIAPMGTRYKITISGNEWIMGFTNDDEGQTIPLGDPSHTFELESPPPTWPAASAFVRVDTKGQPGGVASLDGDGKVPAGQLPPSEGGGAGPDFETPVTITAALTPGFSMSTLLSLLEAGNDLIRLGAAKLPAEFIGGAPGEFVYLPSIEFSCFIPVSIGGPGTWTPVNQLMGMDFDGRGLSVRWMDETNTLIRVTVPFDINDHGANDAVNGAAYDSLDGRITTAGTAISSLQSDVTDLQSQIPTFTGPFLVPPTVEGGEVGVEDPANTFTFPLNAQQGYHQQQAGVVTELFWENPGPDRWAIRRLYVVGATGATTRLNGVDIFGPPDPGKYSEYSVQILGASADENMQYLVDLIELNHV